MEKQGAPSVVCLGFFDGVHKGHLKLLEAARQAAAREGLSVCVHTFDHAPGSKEFELTTLEEREQLLRDAGADRVAVSAFTEEMRHMTGEDFFQQIVLASLNARHVVCGDDHRFGYRGGWGVKELGRMCQKAGIGLTVVPQVSLPGGQRISSTAIRKAILEKDWALAESMLGRPLPPRLRALPASPKNPLEALA